MVSGDGMRYRENKIWKTIITKGRNGNEEWC